MVLDKHDQAELLEQAKGGSVDAFATLFESFRPMLHAVAYRLIGPDLSDDVVMETYLKAWRGLGGFGARSSLRTWLCRITRNCALDVRRRESRHTGRQVTTEGEDERPILDRIPDPGGRSPEREAELEDLGRWIRDAMTKLSENHRTVLLLREVDGLSYAEIAAVTGTSIGTVMSRLFHARRKMRRLLQRIATCHA